MHLTCKGGLVEYTIKISLFGYDEQSGELSMTERIRLRSINNTDAIEEFQQLVKAVKKIKE